MSFCALLLASFVFFTCVCADDVECDTSQRKSLLDLKKGFNFSSSNLVSWQPASNCCHWEGVICDSDSGLITELDLSNQNITGKVGSSLFNLTSLRKLNLAYNYFYPSLFPDKFELLANLTSLNLSCAGFFDQIPIGIAKLTHLVTLDLSTDYLEGYLSGHYELKNPNFLTLIRNLSSLRELYLDGINISANGYQWSMAVARSVPKLRVLSLRGCSIAGPIGLSLSELHDITVIQLDDNQLNSTVPEFFGKMPSLSVLRLGYCGLNGIFPMDVFLLKNLTEVDLSNNIMLSGSLPEFGDGSRLQSLVLSVTIFSGNLPNSLGKLKHLKTVLLSNCQFSGIIPSSIGNLSRLVDLDLGQNNFSGAIPSILPPSISDLVLSDNMLNGCIPSSIGELRHLRKLDLSNNTLSGHIPASLFALPSLQLLQLNLNHFSGQLQEFPTGSTQLGLIDLSNNRLQGEIPKSVFRLSSLRSLSLASNNFSGTVELDWFKQLRNFWSLDLSYNKLSVQAARGNSSLPIPNLAALKLASCNLTRIPSFLRYQYEMIDLDLSNNKIKGAIPDWIWTIWSYDFSHLNLSHNLFTSAEQRKPNSSTFYALNLDISSNLVGGSILLPPRNAAIIDYSNSRFSSSIPSSIGSYLSKTVFFSLANNNLTGEIPASVCRASSLRVLDLSTNNLTGSIPPCLLEGGTDLSVISLQGNRLQGIIPHNISQECVLRTLNLNGNHLEGRLPDSLANCNELEVVNLGNNRMADSFPYWLGRIPSLRVLVLRSNDFYGPIELPPSTNATDYGFRMLQIFDISSNHFNGSLPSRFFANLRAMMDGSDLNPSLLQFEYSQISQGYYYHDTVTVTAKGLDLTLIKIFTIFTAIDISNNGFTGGLPEVFGRFHAIHVLNVGNFYTPCPTLEGDVNYLFTIPFVLSLYFD